MIGNIQLYHFVFKEHRELISLMFHECPLRIFQFGDCTSEIRIFKSSVSRLGAGVVGKCFACQCHGGCRGFNLLTSGPTWQLCKNDLLGRVGPSCILVPVTVKIRELSFPLRYYFLFAGAGDFNLDTITRHLSPSPTTVNNVWNCTPVVLGPCRRSNSVGESKHMRWRPRGFEFNGILWVFLVYMPPHCFTVWFTDYFFSGKPPGSADTTAQLFTSALIGRWNCFWGTW